MSLRKCLAVVVAAIVGGLVFASVALAASPWTLTTAKGSYAGTCNFNPDTAWLNCHGSLVSGAPEDSIAVVIKSGNCTLVLTPSGNANMDCKKQS